jgi:hypothetical protein
MPAALNSCIQNAPLGTERQNYPLKRRHPGCSRVPKLLRPSSTCFNLRICAISSISFFSTFLELLPTFPTFIDLHRPSSTFIDLRVHRIQSIPSPAFFDPPRTSPTLPQLPGRHDATRSQAALLSEEPALQADLTEWDSFNDALGAFSQRADGQAFIFYDNAFFITFTQEKYGDEFAAMRTVPTGTGGDDGNLNRTQGKDLAEHEDERW